MGHSYGEPYTRTSNKRTDLRQFVAVLHLGLIRRAIQILRTINTESLIKDRALLLSGTRATL